MTLPGTTRRAGPCTLVAAAAVAAAAAATSATSLSRVPTLSDRNARPRYTKVVQYCVPVSTLLRPKTRRICRDGIVVEEHVNRSRWTARSDDGKSAGRKERKRSRRAARLRLCLVIISHVRRAPPSDKSPERRTAVTLVVESHRKRGENHVICCQVSDESTEGIDEQVADPLPARVRSLARSRCRALSAPRTLFASARPWHGAYATILRYRCAKDDDDRPAVGSIGVRSLDV